MGGWTGIWQWVIVLVIVLLLFGGRGKISQLMGDLGKGLKSFKKSMKADGEGDKTDDSPKAIEGEQTTTAQSQATGSPESAKKE